MRTLRSLYNMAIKQKKISSEYYPFADYTIRKEETRKRAISREDLIRFLQYEPKTERHKRAKDYFLISFYLISQNSITNNDLSLEIFNLEGKKLYQKKINFEKQKFIEINLDPKVVTGLYFVKILDNNNVLFSSKMVIE